MHRKFLLAPLCAAAVTLGTTSADAAASSTQDVSTSQSTTQSAGGGEVTRGDTTQTAANESVSELSSTQDGESAIQAASVEGTGDGAVSPQQSSTQTVGANQAIVQAGDSGVHIGDTYQTATNTTIIYVTNIQVFHSNIVVGTVTTTARGAARATGEDARPAPAPATSASGRATGVSLQPPVRSISPRATRYLVQSRDGDLIVGAVTDPPVFEPEPVVIM